MWKKRKTSKRKPRRYLKRKFSRKTKFNKPGLVQAKLRYLSTITADSGGTVQMYLNMTNPTLIVNGSGTVGDWSSFSSLYDMYRVKGMSIKYIPDLPNDTSTVTGFYPIYIVFDPDGAPSFNTSAFIEYENCKFKNLFRPWTYYHYAPKAFNPSAQTTPTQISGGWMDIAAPQSTSYVNLYSQNLDVSQLYGQLLITYYVQFKGRR